MPIYDYRCNVCNVKFDDVGTIATSGSGRLCPACGGFSRRILSPVRVNPDYVSYRCPITDKMITSRREHEENLKRTNSRVLEPGENIDIMAKRRKRDHEIEEQIGETVGRTIAGWAPEKQAQLGQELERGANLDFERSTK
jgi:putative FmdB family regulatory protein